MAVSKLVAVRLPDEPVERLDEYARRMERLHRLKLSRSQQIKSLVELGLKAALEGEASPHPRKVAPRPDGQVMRMSLPHAAQ